MEEVSVNVITKRNGERFTIRNRRSRGKWKSIVAKQVKDSIHQMHKTRRAMGLLKE